MKLGVSKPLNTWLFLCLLVITTQPQCMVLLYRPPSAQYANILTEFETLCENLTLKTNLLIAGDFNFKMDKASYFHKIRLKSMLDSLDLCQHVKGTTHKRGHTLDLLITRKVDDIVVPRSICLSNLISDHCMCRQLPPSLLSAKTYP